jgi:hypothetical protein
MAKQGLDRYYKRSGGRFAKLEHYDLEDMFGRRPRPRLKLSTRLDSAHQRGNERLFRCVLGIENVGRGLARFPLLQVKPSPDIYRIDQYGLDGNGRDGIPRIAQPDNSRWVHFAGGGTVIHPGMTLEITAIRAPGGKLEHEHSLPELIHATPSLVLDYVLAAEGVPPLRASETIDSLDLVKAAWRR